MTVMVTSKYNIVDGKLDDFITWMQSSSGLKLTRSQTGCQWFKQGIDREKNRVVQWGIWDGTEDYQAYVELRNREYSENISSMFIEESYDIEITPEEPSIEKDFFKVILEKLVDNKNPIT
jgi:hypothetical protein